PSILPPSSSTLFPYTTLFRSDHLDYHVTFENYIKAKKKYFDELSADAFALVNADDKRGMVMLQNTKARKHTFGLKKMVDYKGKIDRKSTRLNSSHVKISYAVF